MRAVTAYGRNTRGTDQGGGGCKFDSAAHRRFWSRPRQWVSLVCWSPSGKWTLPGGAARYRGRSNLTRGQMATTLQGSDVVSSQTRRRPRFPSGFPPNDVRQRGRVGRRRDSRGGGHATCKIAGIAFTGSNPVPATLPLSCGNAAAARSVTPVCRVALLRCAGPWHAEAATSLLDQIFTASSSNAMAKRQPAGSSTASS